MRIRLLSSFILLLSYLMFAAGCEPAARGEGDRPFVVATTTMIGDLVRQIAADEVELYVLMGPGIDPHAYRPTTADLGRVRRADRIFFNGLHLEGKMVEMLEQQLGERAVAVVRDIPHERLLPWEEEEGGAYDPHVWFDVELWMIAAQTVRDELIAILPQHEEAFRRRGEELLGHMRELHEYIHQKVQELPEQRRVLITSHDAFNYFGRAYGIDVRGIQGISTETEAGLRQITAAVDFIIEHEVPAIFLESSVNPRTIQRVQADVRARGYDVAIGGELYSDAMGAPGEQPGYEVHTYDGMMRYNIETIVTAMSR